MKLSPIYTPLKFMRHRLPGYIGVVFALVLIALGTLLARGSDASDRQQKLNGGYYLLHQLGDDESQLPLLLDMKHAAPNVVAFADRVSIAGKETVALIENFHDRDHPLRYDANPLPKIEQDVRDSIKEDKQHQLLFGTKDAEFVRALCVSQIEASTYGIHLSKVLAAQESNRVRADELHRLSAHWSAIRNEAYRILRNY